MTADIWDVIIVGAGLSGLSAAYLFKKRNPKLRILVLEGKDRVGGRTVTSEIPAANGVDHWDFGGQWVGSTQIHLLELIKELGLETYPQFNTGKKVHHMGRPDAKVRTYRTSIPALSPWVLMDLTQILWKIDRLCATVCVQDPSKTPSAVELDSMTLHSYVEQHAWTAELKEEMGLCSRTVFGMEPSQMSFLFFLVYAAAAGGVLRLLESTPGSAQELKIKGGTQQLSECLAERVGWKNVRLGSAVTAIWQAFWKENGFSGEIVAGSSTNCPFSVTFDATSPSGNAALVGFIAGKHASQWSSKEAGVRREAVISSLVNYLGPEAASFIHYQEKDWANEDYSGGCPVNVMAPGLLTYYHPSLRNPCGRIHWAGTETATQWCGYMSGAVQAGQRAALEVLAELCPTTLTREEQDAMWYSHADQGPVQQTCSSKLNNMSTNKAMVIVTLTISAAFLLAQHQNILQNVKCHLMNVPSVIYSYCIRNL
ncbi:probable flavin-containing monoamine oxidase A isoform X2 [Channa argus]|uniref:probable flavin-containing monoamine oxidase A isoform X2 n=1 Tax=Channa argus TaxID=215402 RepID=UPI003521F5EF